jgi:DNA polymerase III subunit beta
MVGMSKENFPAIPEAPHVLAKIPAKLMSGLISRTVFAISAEESRYTLNGGLLLVKPDSITMVATDGHRLALAETEHKIAGLNAEVRVLVPKKALLELQRLTAEAGDEGSIEFSRDDSYLFFGVGSRRLVSRILTGQFPNYPAVMPRDNNKFVVLERNELNDAIRRVSQLADQRSRAVKLSVSTDGVELSAQSPEYGEATETIEKPYKGDPITIGFNAQYLLDFLAAVADGPVRFELKDEQSAGQIRPEGDGPFQYRYVIMPMRI